MRDGGARVRTRFGFLVAAATMLGLSGAQAQPPAEFFSGKTLRFTAVYDPGGTYDLYSRLLIAHLPRHVPGHPAIVIQYMPGAGGMTGTLYLYGRAEPDGTQLGMLPRDIAINQMLHPEASRYDARRFNWIGRIASYTGVVFVAAHTGVKTADDLRRIVVTTGAWGPTTESYVTPTLLNALAGTRLQIVTGYSGAAEVDLAIERHEVDARVASWTSVKTTHGKWLADGSIVVPFQTGLKPHPDLPRLPLISELAASDEGRQILEFMNSDATIGWTIVAPPNVPPERVAALRQAFDSTMQDPEFLAEAKMRGLEIVAGRGADVQEVVGRTVAVAPQAIERVKAIINTK
jgi:tripartite-type tricarboxylate transporter receptor subunit TctC